MRFSDNSRWWPPNRK